MDYVPFWTGTGAPIKHKVHVCSFVQTLVFPPSTMNVYG
jgi:hypothetical protein